MAVTRAQRLKIMHVAEDGGVIAPDRSQIIHVFDDGWTIRRLELASDIWREGVLMRNCLRLHYRRATEAGAQDQLALRKVSSLICNPDISYLHSLRDENNLPRLTIYVRERMWGAGSYRNGRICDEYVDRMNEWMSAIGFEKMRYSPPPIPAAVRERATARARAFLGEDTDEAAVTHIARIIAEINIGQLQRDLEEGRFIRWEDFRDRLQPPHPNAEALADAQYQQVLKLCTLPADVLSSPSV